MLSLMQMNRVEYPVSEMVDRSRSGSIWKPVHRYGGSISKWKPPPHTLQAPRTASRTSRVAYAHMAPKRSDTYVLRNLSTNSGRGRGRGLAPHPDGAGTTFFPRADHSFLPALHIRGGVREIDEEEEDDDDDVLTASRSCVI